MDIGGTTWRNAAERIADLRWRKFTNMPWGMLK
jgi:hypothetical protein